MTSPLQKAAHALLGAFNLKVLGQNPDRFGDTVTPVVDIYDQYLVNELLRVSTTVTIAGGSGVTSLVGSPTVPQGFSWRVIAVGCLHNPAAGDVAISTWCAVGASQPNASSSPFFSAQTVGAPTNRIASSLLARPLFLPSGWRLDFSSYLSAGPASNLPMTGVALVQQIPE